jgi:glycosyltransferase involved in cell wall biosynthesis
MPFLEIVTRCYRRPKLLANNVDSITHQTDDDRVHTLLVDNDGIGVAAANAQLATFEPQGDYVWLLDDDDLCIYPDLVRDLKEFAGTPAIVVRMDHGDLGVLPPKELWEQPPVEGQIGCSALVTRADVWRAERAAWASGRYAADFDFASAVLNRWPSVWLDIVASAVQRRSVGAPE